MTEVVLVCGREGEFRRVSASGHASFAARGKDIVCAAETVLLRTALEVLQKSLNWKFPSMPVCGAI